ncbi:DUF5667 domain-containing protein [Actinomycetota bacterium]
MDKKIEKIINKCLVLMEKGHSLDECINRFEDYRDEITGYFKTINNVKSLEVLIPEEDYTKNSLTQIISEAKRRKGISSEKADAKEAIKRDIPRAKKRLLLRPAMIFVVFLVAAIFSFSGTLFASQETVPGQVLYPLKRSFEDFKLIVYPENKKGDLHFQFLNNRIHEATTLLESDDTDTGIFVEDLIDELDMGYKMCQQYNCFSTQDENKVLNSINNIKNMHKRMHGKNSGSGKGNGQENDMGQGQENTGNMGHMGNTGGSSQKMSR